MTDQAASSGAPRRVIVTAGESGIGKAACVALARRGFDVGLTWHRDEDGARAAAREIEGHGRTAVVRRLDLDHPESAAAVVDDLAAELGGLDAFVNNAGTGADEPFLELSLETWRHILDVDLTGAFVCAQAAARIMVRQGRGGAIVNVTSVHEHQPLPGSSAYCAAKGGLGMLTKVMAVELGEHGITVNAVAPGQIATAMTGLEDVDPRTVERERIPLGRPGDAREIAAWIAFLCSGEDGYATGGSFVVDGGLTLMGPALGN